MYYKNTYSVLLFITYLLYAIIIAASPLPLLYYIKLLPKCTYVAI